MRIFSIMLLLLSACVSYASNPNPHSPPTSIECMNTCDAQRELCIQISARLQQDKSRESCMSDWSQCINMCMSQVRN
jgi:hypothetical protein